MINSAFESASSDINTPTLPVTEYCYMVKDPLSQKMSRCIIINKMQAYSYISYNMHYFVASSSNLVILWLCLELTLYIYTDGFFRAMYICCIVGYIFESCTKSSGLWFKLRLWRDVFYAFVYLGSLKDASMCCWQTISSYVLHKYLVHHLQFFTYFVVATVKPLANNNR